MLRAMLPGMVQMAFGANMCPHDGRYCTEPLVYYPANYVRPGLGRVQFEMERYCDIIRTFVLRFRMPKLPEGARWKRRAPDILFGRYEIGNAAQVGIAMSLLKNNTIARARDRWPAFNNNPGNLADPSRENWIVSIPLMPEQTMALIKMGWHHSCIWVYNLFERWDDLIDGLDGRDFNDTDFEMWLQCDSIYMDHVSRAGAARDKTPIVLCRGFQLPETNTMLDRQERIAMGRVPGGLSQVTLCPYMGGCITHIVISYTPDDVLPANAHPLHYLQIFGNGHSLAVYDHVDLEELNWLRCGLLSPMGEVKGRDACNTFMYLVPFCADAFSDYPTSWLDASQLEHLEFKLSSDRELPAGSIGFLTQNMNIRKYATGMTGLKFKH